MSTNDPRGPRRGWPPPTPPERYIDRGATPAAPAPPRSIHEETTLDASQLVRPQQPPPPGWSAPPLGPTPGTNPPQPRPAGLAGLLGDTRRWWVIGGAAAVVVAVVVVALVMASGGDDSSSTDATATTGSMVPAGTRTPTAGTTPSAAPVPAPPPATAAPPPPPVVDAAALPGLLLPADVINQRMNTTAMTGKPPLNELLPGTIAPPRCAGTWGPANQATYNGSGYTALAVQGYFIPTPNGSPSTHQLVQSVVAFPDAGAAKTFYDKQVADWNACKSTHITFDHNGHTEADLGVPTVTRDGMSLMLVPTNSKTAGQQCERDMALRSNVIIDVRACSPTVGSAGLSITREIADKIAPAP